MASRAPIVYKTSSCHFCKNVDTDDMVQCDDCDLWFHFNCVGVTSSIAKRNWSCDRCKYALPKYPSLDKKGKENFPADKVQWRKSQSITSLSSTSSKLSKKLALQQLEEARVLGEKRDREYLQQKYSILEDIDEELGEHPSEKKSFDKSSFEGVKQWAEDVQSLTKDYTNKFTMDDVSITMNDDELITLNQRFYPLAQSSANVQRPKSAVLDTTDREVNEFVAQRKSMDSNLSGNQQSTFVHPVDSANKLPGKIDFSLLSQHANPFTNSNKFRFDMRGEPLKNITVDRKTNSDTFNVMAPGGVRRKQFNSILRESTNGKMRDDLIKPSKLFQPRSVLRSSTNFGQSKLEEDQFNKKASEFQQYSGLNHSQTVSKDIKRPKIDFDNFGISTFKPSSSNVEHLHVEQPSMEQIQSSMRSSNPTNLVIPNTIQSTNSNVPIASNFGNNSSSGSLLIYGPTFNYRQICLPYINLTPNQIASRHTMNRKLPQFFGEPIKWQMFDSAFIHSTLSCGLTNSENLSRLIESLKGDAENAVKCRLLHPDSVPGVMETLRLMFGRPELVINALLDEISNTKPPKPDDLGSIVKFAISVQNLCSTIQFYKSIEHLRNPTLMKSLTDKLPSQIQLNWAFYKQRVGDVNVSTLGDWLYELATVASDVVTLDVSTNKKVRNEADISKNNKNNYMNVQNGAKVESKQNVANVSSKSIKKCPACNKDICKVLAHCEKFKKLDRKERWKLVKSSNLCGCCFGNHRYFNCNQKIPCGIAGCSYFHHVMLHNDSKTEEPEKRISHDDETPKKTCNSMASSQSKFPEIFRIVPVKLFFGGKSKKIFVYFDDGSNLTTLDKALAHQIGLHGSKESLCIKWSFGDTQVESDSNRVSVQISGVHDSAEMFILDDVRTVNKLQLPSQSIRKSWLNQYPYFKDIPITTYENAVPQMIIGLNYSKLMVSLETIEGNWEQPIVCKTRLGWVVQGPNDKNISSFTSSKISLNMCECQSSDIDLHQLVKGFFSFESFDVKLSDRILGSKALMRAYNILESSTIKKGNHYEAALLWRKDEITLPNSYEMAKRRLECVESKMRKNPVLAERICNYFKDFLSKDYIRKLSLDERQQYGPRTWYLPVFPVFNPKKPEKLRLIWDGAAKVKGVSLNSELLAGPDQLVPLPDILRRFREGCIGLSTDITEMFHRINVNVKDQDSQRFLWRDGNVDIEPEVYVVNVLTFGSACSPAIAQFVKNKNAKQFEQEFPKAAEAIMKNHYVDDMIERAHDVDSAVKLIKNVQFIHRQANFNLRNLVSNNQQVLELINGSSEFNDKILVDKLNIDVEWILGMYWNTKTDTFTYSLQFIKLNMMEEYYPTKREVLRIVMSVFDPLGFLSHLLIHAKVLLQEIWRNDVGWDVQLPLFLKDKWLNWVQHLMGVELLHIPRLYSPRLPPNQPTSIQLHIFVDASSEAYSTSAYFRIEDDDGVDSSLVGAKSRVAPNRPISIPRLELQGAVLGSRFAESILQSHYSLNIEKTIIWCDSKTVLFWLTTEPRRYSQFVTFRIGEILDSKINAQWRWIPSEFNVADEATKTKKLPELTSSSRWFVGPKFLTDRNRNFSFELDEPDFTTEEEVRPYYLLTHLHSPMSSLFDYTRFSNWQRLLRAMAYVMRFIRNSKLKLQERALGIFSSDELLAAENCLYRQTQHNCFKEEILIVQWNTTASIGKQKDFDKASIIRTCSPYLDEFGVLRVMSRLDNAHSISESAKHPIILPKDQGPNLSSIGIIESIVICIIKLFLMKFDKNFGYQN